MRPEELRELKSLVHWDWLQHRIAAAREYEASEAQAKAASCQGKLAYDTWGQANAATRHRNVRSPVDIYRCRYCGKYHVGQKRRP